MLGANDVIRVKAKANADPQAANRNRQASAGGEGYDGPMTAGSIGPDCGKTTAVRPFFSNGLTIERRTRR